MAERPARAQRHRVIAEGRATPGLSDALAQAEDQVRTLSADVRSLEAAKDTAFAPPPRAWIADRLTKLHDMLAKRTEKSALAFRALTGAVTLTPRTPEVGKPYFQAACKVNSLNLLVAEGGSNLLQWWRRRESSPGQGQRFRVNAPQRLIYRESQWPRSRLVPWRPTVGHLVAAHGRHTTKRGARQPRPRQYSGLRLWCAIARILTSSPSTTKTTAYGNTDARARR